MKIIKIILGIAIFVFCTYVLLSVPKDFAKGFTTDTGKIILNKIK